MGQSRRQQKRQHVMNVEMMGIQHQNQQELNEQQYGHQQGLNTQQYGYQTNLNSQQLANQQQLNKQGQELQVQTWKETNAAAQAKQLEQAGLNLGLMYSGGGAGGSTIGTGSGGTATGGSASAGSASAGTAAGGSVGLGHKTFDVGQIAQALQGAAKVRAETKLLNAQARNLETETVKTGGVDTEETKRRIKKLEEETKTETQRSGLVMNEAIKAAEEIDRMHRENQIGDQTKNAIIERIGQEAINAEVEKRLLESKIKLNDKQREELKHRIYQNWLDSGGRVISNIGGAVSKGVQSYKAPNYKY